MKETQKMAKKLLRIFLVFLLITVVIFSFSISIFAKESASKKGDKIIQCQDADKADAIYFYSYESRSVLYSKNENKLIFPASTVKIMTGLIACEMLSNRLNEQIVITDEMLTGRSGTSIGLKVGMSVTIEDLLYGAICGGGNDAATALSVICSGSVDAFVKEMNHYTLSLGMSSTIYKNPTGLDENGAQTSIADVALLSKNAVKNALYMKISSAKNHSFNDTVIYNRNALISHFTATQYLNDKVSGLNAGSTENGGYVVSTLAEVGGIKYLCIVMGAEREGGEIYSYKIANSLINEAFSKYSRVKILNKGDLISTLPVECALSTDNNVSINCVVEEDVFAYLPKDIDMKRDLEYRAYFHDKELSAPISKSAVIGGINVYFNGKYVGSTRIISTSSVEENSFLTFMKEMKSFLISRYFLIFIAIALPSVLAFLYFERMKRYRRGRIKRKNLF